MKPNEIRAELKRRGIKIKNLAASLNPPVSGPTVSQTITSDTKSPRVRKAIAAAIEQPVEVVFPPENLFMKRELFELLAACTLRLLTLSFSNGMTEIGRSERINAAIANRDVDSLVAEHAVLIEEMLAE